MSNDFFVCETCGCLDNLHTADAQGNGFECYFCKHGVWHGHFEQRPYNPELDIVLNRPNNRQTHPLLGEPSFS